jgi:hypothetical protein
MTPLSLRPRIDHKKCEGRKANISNGNKIGSRVLFLKLNLIEEGTLWSSHKIT